MDKQVKVYQNGEVVKEMEANNDGDTTITITGLEPDTEYPEGTFEIAYANESGVSERAKVPAFKTLPVEQEEPPSEEPTE